MDHRVPPHAGPPSNGKPSGIIATTFRWRARVTDAARLLGGGWTPHWTASSQQQFGVWNAAFLEWLLTSPNGRSEGTTTNNHFTWYTVQTAALALDSGNRTAAAAAAARATNVADAAGALQKQIAPSGLMLREAARDAGATYVTPTPTSCNTCICRPSKSWWL
jgi:hypothetical protein